MNGIVFHGSLEDAIRSKEKFVENSIVYARKNKAGLVEENSLLQQIKVEGEQSISGVQEHKTDEVNIALVKEEGNKSYSENGIDRIK